MSVDMKQNRKNTLKAILATDNLELVNESDWDTIVEHIEVHKYLINQKITWTITWQDAVFSWYENVYRPVVNILSNVQVRWAFPDMTLGELFFAVTTHWYYMQEEDSSTMPMDAVYDYLTKHGKGLGKFLSMLTISTEA